MQSGQATSSNGVIIVHSRASGAGSGTRIQRMNQLGVEQRSADTTKLCFSTDSPQSVFQCSLLNAMQASGAFAGALYSMPMLEGADRLTPVDATSCWHSKHPNPCQLTHCCIILVLCTLGFIK